LWGWPPVISNIKICNIIWWICYHKFYYIFLGFNLFSTKFYFLHRRKALN
jgi:hypothetical protein